MKQINDYGTLDKVYIVLTQECNLSCPYCIREYEKDSIAFMPFEEVIVSLDVLAKSNNNFELILSGGEPTLHPEFREIVIEAKKRFKRLSIASNGTNFSFFKDSFDILDSIKIQISIDGTLEIHNKLRGVNSFEKSMRTIVFLLQHDIDVSVSSTISKFNINDIPKLFNFIRNIGVRKYKLSQEIASVNRRENDLVGTIEWNAFVQNMQLLAKDWNGVLNAKTLYNFVGKEIPWDKLPSNFIRNCGCQPGLKKIYIYPDSSVIGCPCLSSYKLGNIQIDDFWNVIHKNAIHLNNLIMNKIDSDCPKCKYFTLCKGGCPGASLRTFNVINKADPRCPLV